MRVKCLAQEHNTMSPARGGGGQNKWSNRKAGFKAVAAVLHFWAKHFTTLMNVVPVFMQEDSKLFRQVT